MQASKSAEQSVVAVAEGKRKTIPCYRAGARRSQQALPGVSMVPLATALGQTPPKRDARVRACPKCVVLAICRFVSYRYIALCYRCC